MKYLGVDFGLRRIGLALSEGEIASPLKILEVKNFSQGVEKVMEIIREEGIDKVVVGMPEGQMGKNVTGFIKKLKAKGIEVETADETLSSRRALEYMIEQNIPRKKRKVNDAQAAAIILQDYLDSK